MSECQKLFVAHMGEKLKEEVVEAADIEKPDWLEVDAKLKPGEYLDDFLKSANTSGKCCKCISKARHEVLAFMHRFNGDKLRESVMRPLLGNHGARNHPDDLASCGERGIGENPHQTNAPSAGKRCRGRAARKMLIFGTECSKRSEWPLPPLCVRALAGATSDTNSFARDPRRRVGSEKDGHGGNIPRFA